MFSYSELITNERNEANEAKRTNEASEPGHGGSKMPATRGRPSDHRAGYEAKIGLYTANTTREGGGCTDARTNQRGEHGLTNERTSEVGQTTRRGRGAGK